MRKPNRKRQGGVNYVVVLAAILVAIILAFMLLEPQFFKRNSKSYYHKLSNGWHRVDLGVFSVNTPVRFEYIRQQGIDSYVGIITDNIDTISFDYGWYSNDLKGEEYLRSLDTINGVPAIVVFSKQDNIGVHFPNTYRGDNKLTLYTKSDKKDLIFEIFKTVQFQGISGNTSEQLGGNIKSSSPLFQQNCKACHRINTILVGPALNGVVKRRGEKWFSEWVKNPMMFVETNPEAKKVFEKYGEIIHPSFNFSDDQIVELIDYIERESK